MSSELVTSPSRRDAWRIAWQFVTSDVVLACILLTLAVLLLLSAWLPQAPAIGDDPVAYSHWLELALNRFGPAYTVLNILGLFSISNTLLFRLLAGLLGCVLLVRLVEEVEQACNAYAPSAPAPDAPVATLTSQPLAELVARLRRQRLRVIQREEYTVVDRFPLAEAARILASLGGLAVLAGTALTAALGWQAAPLSISTGETIAIGHDTPYSLRLDSPPDAGGYVSLVKDSQPLAAGPIAPGQPLHAAGLSVHMAGSGPAVRVSATLTDGQPLNMLASPAAAALPELLLRFTSDETERNFATADERLLVLINLSQPGESFYIRVYRTRTGELLFNDNLPPDGLVRTPSAIFKFEPERYVHMAVTHDPGLWWTAAGWLLGALGLAGCAGWPRSRTWLRRNEEDAVEIIGDALPIQPGAPSQEAKL